MAGRKDRRARLEATRRFFTAILERDESQILLHFPLAGQTRTHSLSLSRFFCATDAIDVRISTKEMDHQRRKREKDSPDGNFVQHFATAQNFIYAVYNSLKFASLYPTMWGNGNLGFLNAVRGIGTCLHTVPSSILGTRLFAGERWFLLLENCFLRFVDSDAKQTTGVVCTLHPLLFLPFFLSFCIFI